MAVPEQSVDTAWRAGIEAKLAAGERLTGSDGAALLGCADLSWLGGLAHRTRIAAAGQRTVFVAADVAADDAAAEDASVPDGVGVLRYGRDVSAEDRARALLALRDDADTEPLRLVLPVRLATEPPVSPAESLKLFAVARLLLGTTAEVGCDLGSHAASTGALLQHFGASALVVPTDGFDADDIAELVSDAGFTPVHVDTDGAELRRFDVPPSQAERRAEPQSVFS